MSLLIVFFGFQVTDEDEEEAEEVDQDQCFLLFSKPKAQRHDFFCNHQEESSESSESSDSKIRSNVTNSQGSKSSEDESKQAATWNRLLFGFKLITSSTCFGLQLYHIRVLYRTSLSPRRLKESSKWRPAVLDYPIDVWYLGLRWSF